MLRASSVKTMGEEHYNSGLTAPLFFASDNKVIQSHLCTIDEISELSFPKIQSVGTFEVVAVLVTQDSLLGKWAVYNVIFALSHRL